MATAGKKGKKNKGKVLSLQSFLSNGETTQGVTQVTKKVRARGFDSDEEDSLPQVYSLPTAPRSSRVLDDDSIPHKPPFLAHISNLPFDAKAEDIYEYFHDTPIVSLRLPPDDTDTGRIRGFGYIQFETRDDLIHAISLPDPHIRNRRVRIDISNENDQHNKRSSNNRSRYDGFGSSENRESTNWRQGGGGNRDEERSERRGGYDRDRGYNRDRPPRDGSQEGGGGSWRTGDRPVDSSPKRGGYNNERFRGNDERSDGGGRRDNFRRGGRDRERDAHDEEDSVQERPRLQLKPRTLPLPEVVTKPEEELEEARSESPVLDTAPKTAGIPAESVFGSAKPVDTAAREKAVEERLESERKHEEEKKHEEESKQEENTVNEKLSEIHIEKVDKENKNAAISWRRNKGDDENRKYSPERRGPPRRNDERRTGTGRDNRDRDGGRDRRGDYNRERGGFDRDNRHRDNTDRPERNDRDNYNRDRGLNKDKGQKDTRQRDDTKPKRDSRPDKPLPKMHAPAPVAPAIQTTNKYSGLSEEEDGSD